MNFAFFQSYTFVLHPASVLAQQRVLLAPSQAGVEVQCDLLQISVWTGLFGQKDTFTKKHQALTGPDPPRGKCSPSCDRLCFLWVGGLACRAY